MCIRDRLYIGYSSLLCKILISIGSVCCSLVTMKRRKISIRYLEMPEDDRLVRGVSNENHTIFFIAGYKAVYIYNACLLT